MPDYYYTADIIIIICIIMSISGTGLGFTKVRYTGVCYRCVLSAVKSKAHDVGGIVEADWCLSCAYMEAMKVK